MITVALTPCTTKEESVQAFPFDSLEAPGHAQTMPVPIITAAPAVLQPRAPSATLCWYASSTVEDVTVWAAVTYDPAILFVTSYNNFPVWVDACNGAWCNTLLLPTMCTSGYIWGISVTSACTGSGQQCITELMYQRSGDATPKLSKVGCGVTDSAKTYFVESPPARKAGEFRCVMYLYLRSHPTSRLINGCSHDNHDVSRYQ